MRVLRTALVLALLGLLFVWLASKVGTGEPTYHHRTDNTLRRHVGDDPPYLNAILGVGRTARWAMQYLNHYMVEWDLERGDYVPRLCTAWDISPDGLDYTFYLRRDVRWHDGEPFDAEDARFSFLTVMNPQVRAGHARANYLDSRFVAILPEAEIAESIGPAQFLQVRLDRLPVLESAPRMDGEVEPAAARVAESASGSLYAALLDGNLYLAGTRLARHDTSIFLANYPGALTRYAPGAEIAEASDFLLADCGNLFPGPSGWYVSDGNLDSATFAVGEDFIEGLLPLRPFFKLDEAEPLPEVVHLCLAWVDDVQLTCPDAHTVRFHFPRKNYENLPNAGQLRLVPEHYYRGQDFMTHPRRDVPLGLGPYKFVRWDRGNLIELERWEDYWGKKPAIKRIVFRIIGDGVVAFQVFRRGDLDLITASVWTYTRKCVGPEFDKHFRKVDYYQPGYGFVSYNCDRSFFSDKRCRQAMSHLIDVKNALLYLQEDINKPITGPHFWKGPAYDSSLPLYEYSPEKAARLLDEAGWIDHDGDGIRDKDLNGDGKISKEPLDEKGNLREVFSFEVLWGGSSLSVQDNWIPLSLQRNCPKVGVECTIRTVGSAIQLTWLRDGDFDATSGAWDLDIDHDPTPFFHSTQSKDGFNYGRFNDPVTDRLLEAARQELDKEKRTAIFRQLHRRIWEEQPYTFTYSHNWRWVLNRRIKNVKVYDMDFDYLSWELEHSEGN
ncbi:hypothetical protein HS125_06770 [bacterium]|nr:hypothetical protein [bacterium]